MLYDSSYRNSRSWGPIVFFCFLFAIPPDRGQGRYGSLLRGHSLRVARATIPAGCRNTGRPLWGDTSVQGICESRGVVLLTSHTTEYTRVCCLERKPAIGAVLSHATCQSILPGSKASLGSCVPTCQYIVWFARIAPVPITAWWTDRISDEKSGV